MLFVEIELVKISFLKFLKKLFLVEVYKKVLEVSTPEKFLAVLSMAMLSQGYTNDAIAFAKLV